MYGQFFASRWLSNLSPNKLRVGGSNVVFLRGNLGILNKMSTLWPGAHKLVFYACWASKWVKEAGRKGHLLTASVAFHWECPSEVSGEWIAPWNLAKGRSSDT